MSNVTQLNAHLLNVHAPDSLRQLPAWLIWRYEPAQDKPRKVPYYAASGQRRFGRMGAPSDRAQLVTFEEARSAAARKGFEGVGFAPLPEFKIVALDFDNCVSDGQVHSDVQALVLGSYAEFSPSGRGVRAFFHGALSHNVKLFGEPFSVEVFSTAGFVTYTGNPLDITKMLGCEDHLADLPAALLAHLAQRRPPRALSARDAAFSIPSDALKTALTSLDADCAYHEWIAVGMALQHELGDEGFDIWDTWSSTGAKYPGAAKLRAHWDSFSRRENGANYTGATLLHFAREAKLKSVAQEFDNLTAGGVSTALDAPRASAFAVQNANVFAQAPAPQWRIKNLLPEADLVVLYGESGAGKSFMALDLTMAMARGVPWRGLKTQAARVAYVAAEGAGGFRKRLKAYALHNEVALDALPFGVIDAAPNLLALDDCLNVVKEVQAWGGAKVVVVDTLAQTTPGANENAGEDMGKALAHCRKMSRALNATVILIHHSGKDASRGARGWSGIRAAADAELEVTRSDGHRQLQVTKQKDGDDSAVHEFALLVVPIGIDEEGDVIDSCVIAPLAAGAAGQGHWQKRLCGLSEADLASLTESGKQELLDRATNGLTGDARKNARRSARRALAGF